MMRPMNGRENDEQGPRSRERSAFAAVVALLLAPVIAHGLWRPLVHVFGPWGDAGTVTGAALAISGVIVVVQGLRPARALRLSLAAGGLVAIGAALGGSLGPPGVLTLLCVAAAMAMLMRWLPPRLPSALDGLARRHRWLTVLYVVLALSAVVTTARLSIFMGDPTRVDQQVLPGEEFLETHSCLTAYARASTLSGQRVDNLYAERWWHGSHGFAPDSAGAQNPYQPFDLDYYAYPPPFLLVMAPLVPLDGDFPAQRALWFGLNGLLLAAGLWVVARWVDGPRAHRVLLLAPIFFGSLPVLATLQVGNFQIAVVMMSILAMVAFHRDRPVEGGALLAFAILSKISPGVLGIVLLAQRRWLCAAWTAGFGVLFVALSLLVHGLDPMESFLTYTLARLGSGEAFAFMDDEVFSLLTNMAPFGLPFKLQLAGLDVGDPWLAGRRIGRVYTVVLVLVAVVVARRRADRRAQAMTWMSLLVLAALQSPFAPGYVTIGLLWALTLASTETRGLAGGAALVLLWLLITVVLPISVPLLAAYGVLQSSAVVGASLWLMFRAVRAPTSGGVGPVPSD